VGTPRVERTAEEELTARSIADFGEQWSTYRDNPGYYGSPELFADILEPLMTVADVRDMRVADIGSGTGRLVRMLAAAGARRIVAVEPSEAMEVLKRNTSDISDRTEYVHARGEELPGHETLDLVVSIGVLHHVPDPSPIVRRAFEALRPGGKMLVWLYGREGNAAYLMLALPLRTVTRRLPHAVLAGLCRVLDVPLVAYMHLCGRLPLPLHDYMSGHLARLSPEIRRLTIYDQLNPAWAKFYTRAEAVELLSRAGFADVRAHHRHGYSWTVVGTRP
jgi:2-polyprenyl-3-methyl-5-hydroxy-6-metoxy-1,4-benzoquinol methylase